uniref:Uncharacterized protein n=1 Tax=Setaria viridis TaxID=4556 RepID=A0A4U6W016_SETVI|nr:hypothetical protein SEVIR_2G326650v2 [Setaria viridis]
MPTTAKRLPLPAITLSFLLTCRYQPKFLFVSPSPSPNAY